MIVVFRVTSNMTLPFFCFGSHNFYIFPRRELPTDDLAYEFLCQTTSINFLARHQFDFNAWIHEGD